MARKTVEPAAAVDPVDALPTVTISGAVPALVSEAVEGYRWQNRMSRADVGEGSADPVVCRTQSAG